MNHRVRRRSFLAAAGITGAGILAGCIGRDDTPATLDHPPTTLETQTSGGEDPGLYERTINSVPLVRAFGVDADPSTPGEDRIGQGSGFVTDGLVITNEHVVSGADAVDLRFPTGDWTPATILGTDIRSDLAVLEPEFIPDAATGLRFTPEPPVIGQPVKAIGNPFGLRGSISTGVISGLDRVVSAPTGVTIPHAIQTDAALNPGNSGGPLIDAEGTVVGVNSAGGGQNIGFAVSAALSQRVVPALRNTGRYRHAFLGVSLITVDPVVATANHRSTARGVLIAGVTRGGPADGVLRESSRQVERYGTAIPVGGDILLGIDGYPVQDQTTLGTFLALETSPGQTVELTIDRRGREQTTDLTLGTRPQPQN